MSLEADMENRSIPLSKQESIYYPAEQEQCIVNAISGAAVLTQVNKGFGSTRNNCESNAAYRAESDSDLEGEISSLLERSPENFLEKEENSMFPNNSDKLCDNVTEHIKEQESMQPFVCHTSQKRFKKQYHLSRKYHTHKTSPEEHCCTHKTNPKKSFTCDECSKQFFQKGALKQHILILHMNQRIYICNHCQHTFGQKSNLNKHINVVHLKNPQYTRRFVCGECEKGFQDERDLSRHFVSHETSLSLQQRKPFSCDRCGSRYTRRNGLNRHKRAVHNNVKPFSCHGCGKAFTRKYILAQHISRQCCRLEYKTVKPYSCDGCKKAFTHKRSLIVHLRQSCKIILPTVLHI